MAELKTKPTDQNVTKFIESVTEGERRSDCVSLLALMRDVTGEEPKMWGSSIIGFGREGDWMATGFSPRKNDLTLYITSGFERYPELMKKLGKYKTGKSCLYVKKLRDVDMKVLRELVEKSFKDLKKGSAPS
jgi:hypothetical protein